MNGEDIRNRHVHTQRLAGPPFDAPEAMVRALVGVQAQDYAGARWSVGQRTADCTDADVARAFDEGRILRTHVLRPTWHFVTPDDIRWLLELTAPRVHALNAYSYRTFALDDALFARSQALFAASLGGGRQRTRPELAAMLAGVGIVADGLRLGYILMRAELDGLLCSGAMRGKQQTYALLAERAPGARSLTREEALAELARRFFAGHGPATLHEFVRWSGLAVADARRGLELVKEALVCERVAGHTLWFAAAPPPAPPAALTAYLLPEFDECVLTYKEVGFPDLPWGLAADAWRDTFSRPIIIDGQRAGTWRRTIARSAVTVEANLFAALDAAQVRAIESAVARYGTFLNLPATLALTP